MPQPSQVLALALLTGCVAACTSFRHGFDTAKVAGQTLPTVAGVGAARLSLEMDADPALREFVHENGRPDYLHVVHQASVHLFYLERDRLVRVQRGVAPSQRIQLHEPIPDDYVTLLPWRAQRALRIAREEHPERPATRPATPVDPYAASVGRAEQEALEAHLTELGARVTRHATIRGVTCRFGLADSPVPNAVALPNGTIYVSRGLVALVNTEDELLNVLGHEVAHVAAQHHRLRVIESWGTPGQALFNPNFFSNLMAYTREHESEADRLGQQFAKLAGADPAAMARFFRAMDASERLRTGTPRVASWFDTHPPLVRRAAEAALRAEFSLAELPDARERAAFLPLLDGLLLGENPSHGLLRGTLFVHPTLGFAVRFPADWSIRNSATAVTGIAPRGNALIVLQFQGRGDEPEAAAERFLAQVGRHWRVTETEAMRIRGLPAHRIRAEVVGDRHSTVYAAWLAWEGRIVRFESVTHAGSFPGLHDAFLTTARSFRPLAPGQLDGLEVTRLRLVRAAGGETLTELTERAGSVWAPRTTSVMNGLPLGEPLPAGTWVKIARSEPWRTP